MNYLYQVYYLQKAERFLLRRKFKGKWKLLQFLKCFLPEAKDNVIVKTKLGFKLLISPIFDRGIERTIFRKGIYEEGTLWCFKKLIKEGDVIFDIGANIGLTTIYAGLLTGKNGKVFAFEPVPTTYEILIKNIRLNRLKNIKPVNIAISDRNERSIIYTNLHINRGAASFFSGSRTDGIEINSKSLDQIFLDEDSPIVNFIKIDIEGAEVALLQGGNTFFSCRKPIICIEFSKDILNCEAQDFLYNFLVKAHKYKIYKQINGKERISQLIEIESRVDLPQHDNLFCFQDFHFKAVPEELFHSPEA